MSKETGCQKFLKAQSVERKITQSGWDGISLSANYFRQLNEEKSMLTSAFCDEAFYPRERFEFKEKNISFHFILRTCLVLYGSYYAVLFFHFSSRKGKLGNGKLGGKFG